MRLIVIGCEYAGKTTLLSGLAEWGRERGIHFHMDDHFTIPDCQTVTDPEDRQAMCDLPSSIKERFQRFQIAYHVRLLYRYDQILLAGFHIEEAVYGPRYYYPDQGRVFEPTRRWEPEMPDDTILCLLTCAPEKIQSRMEEDPHEYPVVWKEDVAEVLEQFESEYRASWLRHRLQIDTTDLAPKKLLTTFLDAVRPHLTARDLSLFSG
jgi:hypothetical protein